LPPQLDKSPPAKTFLSNGKRIETSSPVVRGKEILPEGTSLEKSSQGISSGKIFFQNATKSNEVKGGVSETGKGRRGDRTLRKTQTIKKKPEERKRDIYSVRSRKPNRHGRLQKHAENNNHKASELEGSWGEGKKKKGSQA